MSEWGTRFVTWLSGVEVGGDRFGNRYFRHKTDSDKRWVLYNGVAEASKVPPEWHAWLHRTVAEPPKDVTHRAWEKPHLPNLTGTDYAYRPAGAIGQGGKRPAATGDYEAWQPE